MHKDYDSFFTAVEDDIEYWVSHPEMHQYTTINQDKSIRISTSHWGEAWFKVKIKLPGSSDNVDHIIFPPAFNTRCLSFPKRLVCNAVLWFSTLLQRVCGNIVNSYLMMHDQNEKYFCFACIYTNDAGNFISLQCADIHETLWAIQILRNVFTVKELRDE